jgi:hypothetical protein
VLHHLTFFNEAGIFCRERALRLLFNTTLLSGQPQGIAPIEKADIVT